MRQFADTRRYSVTETGQQLTDVCDSLLIVDENMQILDDIQLQMLVDN